MLGGSGARSAPALPQPPPAPFAASQQLLKAEKKKRKRIEKHFEKQSRGKRPSSRQPHPLLLLPAPASFVLPTLPSQRGALPECWGSLSGHPRVPEQSTVLTAPRKIPHPQRWLLPETSPVTPESSRHSRGVQPLPQSSPRAEHYPENPGWVLCPPPPCPGGYGTRWVPWAGSSCILSPFPAGTFSWPAVPGMGTPTCCPQETITSPTWNWITSQFPSNPTVIP